MEVELKDLVPIYRLTEEQLKEKLKDYEFTLKIAKAYALKKKLHNGATMKIGGGYRNEGLLFWDAQNKEIVEPFTEIDDYGSVPPRFVVGDGYFNPNDWLDEVDHNTYVFPARPLMNEMKEFAEKYPGEKKMIVEINGTTYTVYYNQNDMKGEWDSCILEVHGPSFSVFPGDPRWRETIVDEDSCEKPRQEEVDSVVASVLESFKQRAATGQKKYGKNLDRTDLKTLDWIQHLQEELMDATLYLEKLKNCFKS